MSHVRTNPILIGDLVCLEKALTAFPQLTLVPEKKTYEWFGEWVGDYHGKDAAYKNGFDPKDFGKCDHAIRVDGSSYEIGLVAKPQEDGTIAYALIWDFWGSQGRKIDQVIGDGGQKLLTEYARQVAMHEASLAGLTYSEETVGTDIVVTLTGY